MQLNLLFSVLAAKLIRAKGLYVPLFTMLLMTTGQAKAQVSIVEGDTAYICQNGRTSQNLTAVTQLGYNYKWYNLDKSLWYKIGSSFGNSNTSYPSLAFKGSTPYVAMKDTINNAKLIVVKYNGTSWEQVGGPIQWGFDQKISFKGDTPFVAFADLTEGGKNSVYKYDGTSWVKVGNSVGGLDVNANFNYASRSLCFNAGVPYVSFVEADSSSKVVMYKFDGTAWVAVGNAFGPTNSLIPTMSFNLDTAYVVMTNTNNFNTEVYKFNGTNWVQVGLGVGVGYNSTTYKPTISFNGNTPYIAFTDASSANENVVYSFNGTSWVKVGNSFGTYGVPDIKFNNGTAYALVKNYPSVGYAVYTFNGISWVKFDSSFGGQYTGEHSLVFNAGAPYAIFKEGLSSVLSVYKFGPQIVSDLNSFSANTIGTYVVEEMAPNGVLTYDTIEVLNAPLVTAGATATAVTCTDGNINVTVNGGTPPFNYEWSNAATTQNLTAVGLGYYMVEVTDDFGCTATAQAIVKALAPVANNFITQNDTALICTANPAILSVNTQMGSEYKWFKVDSTNWQQVANLFGGNGSQTPDLTMHEGTAYVAFSDANDSYKSAVYFFNGLAWQQLGGSFGNNYQYGQSIVFNNGIPYVASNEGSNGYMVVYKFDGTNWVQVGSGFGSTYSSKASLSFNGNTPYVAFNDQSNNRQISVFKFDGTSWAQVGSSLGGDYIYDYCLEFNAGIPYVALSNYSNNNKIAVYSFNGTSWTIVGAMFGGDYSYSPSLAFNAGVPFVAFSDGASGQQTAVYRFNGSTWVLYGGGRFGGTSSFSQSLRFDGGLPYVAFNEGSSDNQSAVYKHDGSSWVKIGGFFGGYTSGNQRLSFNAGIPYVSFLNTDRQVSVFKFDYANISNQTSISVYTAGAYVAIETDMNGCMKTDTITVIQQNIQPPIATATAISTSCSNVSSGAINLSVTLGATPYTYNWSTSETTQNISNLSIGDYSVIVIDSVGCSASAFASVLETPVAQANLITQGDSAFACGNSNAHLSVSAIPGYVYQWYELDSFTLQQQGTAFGGDNSYSQSLKVNNGIPYVAFSDADNSYQTSVYKHDGTAWVKVGNSFGNNDSYDQSLYFINNIPYVTSGNNDNDVTVYSFDGTNWVQVGASIANTSQPALSSKGVIPYVAVKDESNDGSTSVYTFNGTNWVQVGGTFGGESSNGQELVISDTTLYVSLNDGDENNTNSVYSYDGTNWVKLGNSLGGDYSGYASLAVNNGIPYVAFDDSYSDEDDNHKIAVYKYDGATWVQLGGQFGGGSIDEKSISFNDTIPYVAFADDYGQNNKMVLYQFNGTQWTKVGKAVGGESSYNPSLSFDNGIAYLAFSDADLMNQSAVYKFSPTQISSALAITTNREGLYVVKTSDPDGCRFIDTVAVVHKNIPAIEASTITTTTCSNISTGSISLMLTNGTAPYTYNWSNGQTSQNATLLALGNYSVIAIDSNGCSVSANAKVTETPATPVNIITQGDLLSQCVADTALLSVVQQLGYTYQWYKGDSIVWQQIGSPFGGEYSAVQRLCFDGKIPYVAFRDADEDGRISVYTLSGGNWVQLGNTFGDENYTGWIDGLTLSLRINDGVPYVAFSDYNDYQISVYKFDGTDWVQVGDKFGDESEYQSLSFDGNTPYVAFEDYNNSRRSVVYYFNGAEWEQLGDAFGEYDCEYQSLEIHNGVPYVAFIDGDDYETYVYKYNGTNWEQVGSSFGDEDARYHSLVFDNNTPYVAIAEDDGYNSVYQFNGTNWVKVGPSFGGYSYFNNLAFNNGVPYVALSDEDQDYQSTIYKFNGTTWELVGSPFGGESAFQSIAFSDGELYLTAYSEDNDYQTTVYKFGSAEIGNTNEVVVQTAGQYIVKSTNPDGCRGNDTVLIVNYVAAGNNTMGADQTICNGSTPTDFLANTPGLGDTVTYSFTWLSSTLDADNGFAPASGVNNTATYTPVPLTDTTWYKRIVNSSICGVDTSVALAIAVTLDSAGTWTGAENWVWANTANWSCPSIPTGVSRVTIPSSANYMPQIIDAREVLDLTIEGGASLSLNNSASELTIYGAIINNGNFGNYSGKVVFAGTAPQTIPNGNYRKIEINNPAGVNMNGSVTVNDSLILTDGIVQLGSQDLYLSYNGYASKGSPTSYVSTNGTGKLVAYYIGQYDKSDTVYIPIGNSTYNPISIIDKDNYSDYTFSVIDSITATYNGYEPTGSMYTNGAVNRTWVINQSNGGTNTASITFGWTAASELPYFDRNVSFVSYYNNNDSEWVTAPGTAASGSVVYNQTITGVTTNNVFGIGSGNGVGLPVNLVNLLATKQQNNVNLTWTTATEINNDYFELQRSVDGKTFETIANVKGNGTTHVLTNYEYLDNKVSKLKRPTANVFYRLIQTDFDGTKTTSKIVIVNMDEPKASSQQLTAAISPNPFRDVTNVTVTTAKAEKATLKVTDTQGRLVFEKQVDLQTGENQIIIDELGSAHSGIYFVNIITATESLVQRIAKAK